LVVNRLMFLKFATQSSALCSILSVGQNVCIVPLGYAGVSCLTRIAVMKFVGGGIHMWEVGNGISMKMR
jgi:hypothetical protein